jgi:hypothetical protein
VIACGSRGAVLGYQFARTVSEPAAGEGRAVPWGNDVVAQVRIGTFGIRPARHVSGPGRPSRHRRKEGQPMPDTKEAGDAGRLDLYDDQLPTPPEHEGEDGEHSDQPEPEEVSDAVLDR